MAHTSPIKLATIADWHHLAWALQRASRGKRHRPAVQQALAQPEATLAHLSACLGAGILPCGQWRAFTIYDPKQRQIHAAPFLDRVAHHALVRRLEPVFERVLLPSVFACRPT
ncbi:MAG: alpha/beta hydrolase, partial [Gammaproteobacteria bacterium]|nr:alpha/beta hydrolase [Gammaproteobacteria bacterium]